MVDSVPVAIVVSVAPMLALSLDIVMVVSEDVVVVVDSVFFDSQAVARATTDITNRADFAKPFMILCV